MRAALARLQAEGLLRQSRRQGPLVVTLLDLEGNFRSRNTRWSHRGS